MPATLPAAELILRPGGTLYHLGLAPSQVPPLIITVGDPGRVPAVSARFDAVESRVQRREFRSHVGRFAGRRILCISTGIGTDNVDVVVNELDAAVNVDFDARTVRPELRPLTFVRLGTSGAIQADLPVDTLLATDVALGLDGLGPQYGFAPGALAGALNATFPEWSRGAYEARASDHLLGTWERRGTRTGTTLTAAGFYGPQRRSLRLAYAGPSMAELTAWRSKGARLDNFEMETAGLYALCTRLGHRATGVSALLANRATGEFSGEPERTVDRLIDEAFAAFEESPELWWGQGRT